MHVRISMSVLNEREDQSMIAHVCDECMRRVLFFSDIIKWALFRFISTVSMASAVRNCRCPWKLKSYMSCAFLDR